MYTLESIYSRYNLCLIIGYEVDLLKQYIFCNFLDWIGSQYFKVRNQSSYYSLI